MKVLGIDPGKSGGLAIYEDRSSPVATPMPITGKEIDFFGIISWAREMITDWTAEDAIDFAVIEKVGAMPGQGVVSMFSFGFSTGGMHGLMAGLGIPRRIVHPRTWKTLVLAGTAKDKDAAVSHVVKAYPKTNILATSKSRKPHLGMVDAICIAEWGWRTFKEVSK